MPLALTLVLSLAAPATTDAPQAAGRALIQCVAHSMGTGTITDAHASELAANGLIFSDAPPPALASAASTPYGKGSFAASPSTEGQVWAVGYDSGVCIVFAIGVPEAPVEARFRELFAIPGAWRPEPIPSREGARWFQHGWQVRQDLKLVAQTMVRPIAEGESSFIMTTIAPRSQEGE